MSIMCKNKVFWICLFIFPHKVYLPYLPFGMEQFLQEMNFK